MYYHIKLNTIINTMTVSRNEQNYNKQYNESATHPRCCRIVTQFVKTQSNSELQNSHCQFVTTQSNSGNDNGLDIDDGMDRRTNGQTCDTPDRHRTRLRTEHQPAWTVVDSSNVGVNHNTTATLGLPHQLNCVSYNATLRHLRALSHRDAASTIYTIKCRVTI